MKFLICFQISILVFLVQSIYSCYLWGTDSGTCSEDPLDPLWRAQFIPYCMKFVKYPACLPTYQTLPSSREFPDGRWFNHTIITKDTWVATKAEAHIKYRIDVETNRSLQRKSEDEYGQPGRVTTRFHKNPDCVNAYRALFCYLNFPRCDVSRDMTYPTCRSACENYFKSCRYGKGLWRCGQSKYFNGYEPEAPVVDAQGNVTYLRDYFPGQPFRKNKYTTAGSEIGFCTPAITGAASSRMTMGNMLSVVAMSVLLGVGMLLW